MKRNGVTLLEILLVVAVLTILAGLAVPLWSGLLATEKVKQGADILRAELGSTRVMAIREGEEYAFCYTPDTGQFWQEPLSQSTQFSGAVNTLAPSSKLSLPPKNFLPEGVTFMAGEAQESTRSEEVEDESGAANGYERVIFYPDGTAQTAGIIIQNENGDSVMVTVRGLTGGTSASGFLDE